MILLAQSHLLPPDSVWLPADSEHLLLKTDQGTVADGDWFEHGKRGRSMSLLPWLQELLRKRPATNHVCLLWSAPDPLLESVVRLLSGQTEDFNIEATLVLAGPIVHQDGMDALVRIEDSHGGDRFLHTVAYLGSEDADGHTIASKKREQTIFDLAQLLIFGGEEVARKLRLFTANRSASPFTPFGLEFHGRRPTDVPPAVVGYSRALFASVFQSETNKQQSGGRILEREPATLLDRLGTLHTPRDAGGKWPDRLPELANVFCAWRPPWFRSAALRDGEHMLAEQRREAENGL
ncbi:MAG: hypothetical protein MUF12_02115, partial [Sediminibacterium sp.]|nr:hypothetical protein [Sediminibacterium sp.]